MINKNWLNKCLKIETGIKIKESNINISDNYLIQAQNTLKNIKRDIEENDFLWSSVKIYYCAYHSLYSFLQKLGFSSENHSCSIELFKYLLENEELSNMIEKFKNQRISAQYYLQFPNKEEFFTNYEDLKVFYLKLNKIISELNEDKIKEFKMKINKL